VARWRVRLGSAAERDFANILAFTADEFGERQARVYQTTLMRALTALHAGPNIPGSRARPEIQPGLRLLHVARKGRRGRHFILYREGPAETIEVLRILHDAMDFARHLAES